MAYWWWLTQRGAAIGLQSQAGDVIGALRKTQPARLATIVAQAEADGAKSVGPVSDIVSFYLWRFRRAGLAERAKAATLRELARASGARRRSPRRSRRRS